MKKYLIGIFIIGLGFINFSNSVYFDFGQIEERNNLGGYNDKQNFGKIDSSLSFTTQYLGSDYENILYYQYYNGYFGLSNAPGVLFFARVEKDGNKSLLFSTSNQNRAFSFLESSYCILDNPGTCGNGVAVDNLYESLKNYNFVGYNLGNIPNLRVAGYDFGRLNLCFKTDNDKYLCFPQTNHSYGNVVGSYFSASPEGIINDLISRGYTLISGPISTSGGGGETTNNTNLICPTIGQIIQAQFNGYSEYLCYGGFEINDIMNEGDSLRTYKAGSGANIFELYEQTKTGFNNIQERYETYYTFYTEGRTTEFYGIPKGIAGLMSARKVRQQGYTRRNLTTNNIITYCDLLINYDTNQTTCTLTNTGNQYTTPKENITINDIESLLGITDRTATNPNTGTLNNTGESVFNILQTEEQEKKRDVVKSVQSIYYKITGLFYKRNGIDGIIPEEITRIIILMLLFKLFKK